MSKHTDNRGPRLRNSKAHFRFEFLDKMECGIVLLGAEVKSLRDGQASIDESFARIRDGEVWLHGFHIGPYACDTSKKHDALRSRKLLLHKRQITKLAGKLAVRGLTLVPLELYFNDRGLVKVTLALARGKTLGDKRATIREREVKREISRALRPR